MFDFVYATDGRADVVLVVVLVDTDVFAIDGKTGKLITSILNEYPDQYYGTFHCTLSHSAPAIIESGNQMLIALPFACNFEGDLEGKKAKFFFFASLLLYCPPLY